MNIANVQKLYSENKIQKIIITYIIFIWFTIKVASLKLAIMLTAFVGQLTINLFL